MCSLTLLQLQHQLGEISEPARERIRALSTQKLLDLGVALLDFDSHDDLDKWLGENSDDLQNGHQYVA
jgi:hypothetical protein